MYVIIDEDTLPDEVEYFQDILLHQNQYAQLEILKVCKISTFENSKDRKGYHIVFKDHDIYFYLNSEPEWLEFEPIAITQYIIEFIKLQCL
jgi:hypothetical protein